MLAFTDSLLMFTLLHHLHATITNLSYSHVKQYTRKSRHLAGAGVTAAFFARQLWAVRLGDVYFAVQFSIFQYLISVFRFKQIKLYSFLIIHLKTATSMPADRPSSVWVRRFVLQMVCAVLHEQPSWFNQNECGKEGGVGKEWSADRLPTLSGSRRPTRLSGSL